MTEIILAIIAAPPILRWVILVPLTFIGIVAIDAFFMSEFKIQPMGSLIEFLSKIVERTFKYVTIGACLTFGGLIVLKFICH